IPSDESKVHIEVLSVLQGNRLPILDGSLPLSSISWVRFIPQLPRGPLRWCHVVTDPDPYPTRIVDRHISKWASPTSVDATWTTTSLAARLSEATTWCGSADKIDYVQIRAKPATTREEAVPEHTIVETYKNTNLEKPAYFNAEAKAIHMILSGIGDDIYSTVDACTTSKVM
nr:hypothetical protein [Tanacetum cinerariifolium]